MGYSVELSFDDASSSRIAAIWQRLDHIHDRPSDAELGLRPHVSLAVLVSLEPHDTDLQKRASFDRVVCTK